MKHLPASPPRPIPRIHAEDLMSDATAAANRKAFREWVAATESSRAVAVTGVAIVVLSLMSSVFLDVTPVGELMHLIAAVSVLLLAGALRYRPPAQRRVPMLVAAGATVVVSCLLVELWVDPMPLTAVYVLLAMIVYGPFVLSRRLMLATSIPLFAIYSVISVLRIPNQDDPEGWVLAGLGAVLLSFILLHLRIESIDRWADAMERIEEMALTDALTGALNRNGLDEALPRLVASARRRHEPLHVVFMDVRKLKSVNDSVGHSAGDAVITAVARAIKETCRGDDLACRWGGDEFIVVGTGPAPDPDSYQERVMSRLEDSAALDTIPWSRDVTAGVAETFPVLSFSPEDLDRLCHEADVHMYQRRGTIMPDTSSMSPF